MSKRLLLTGFFIIGLHALASAQPAATRPPGTRDVSVDPIRCWWRTSAGAVRVGEPFDVSLTCAVLESDAVTVVVDESRLGNAVVQMAPFEVVSGSHPADLHAGIRRFFQYDYRLRIINPDVVGKDVPIPDIALHYRVNSKVSGNEAVQGRDLLYYLPPQAVRITSMVPTDATDIRDASGASFSRIDELDFRAGMFNIVGIALMAFGGLMVLLVLVRLARGARRWTPAAEREASTARLLGVARRELSSVRSERASAGWTDDLVGRALAATRVAAAGAVGRAINQRIAEPDVEAGEGRLLARGLRRSSRRIVSAPTTAQDVARRLSQISEADPQRPTLETLRNALSTFTAAQYGRNGTRDETALDEALDGASTAAAAVQARYRFPRSLLNRQRAPVTPAESQA
jgi:hypothetical protein